MSVVPAFPAATKARGGTFQWEEELNRAICLYAPIIVALASCNGTSVTNIPAPARTPQPAPASTPTIAPTKTPLPTATPPAELTAELVGLPWDANAMASGMPVVTYKPCYVNTATRWHAGDIFMWKLKSGQVIDVVSPVEGKVVNAVEYWDGGNPANGGGNIIVRTPFLLDGKTVFYQLRHSSTFHDTVKVGATLSKGQHIGTLRWDGPKDPGGNSILDFMLLRGDDWHYDSTTEQGRSMFFDTAPYHLDDLHRTQFKQVPRCEGNPK